MCGTYDVHKLLDAANEVLASFQNLVLRTLKGKRPYARPGDEYRRMRAAQLAKGVQCGARVPEGAGALQMRLRQTYLTLRERRDALVPTRSRAMMDARNGDARGCMLELEPDPRRECKEYVALMDAVMEQ